MSGKRFISVRTKSGRRFRFDITDFHVSTDMTPAQLAALAAKIVAEKHRFCEWDRDHPTVNVGQEMQQAVAELLSYLVERVKRMSADDGTRESALERFLHEHALSETIGLNQSRRQRESPPRVRLMWGVYDNSGHVIETFAYADKSKATELAAKLTQDKRLTHYVQPVKQQLEVPE
jgi:ribosomal protein S15P/S13E